MRRAAALLLTIVLAGCGQGQSGLAVASRIPANLAPRFWPPAGWAWGVLRVKGGPPIRYGVAAPVGVPRAHLVIAAGREEPIEAWFETVADLAAMGVNVWVVEGDADAIRAVAAAVVRPTAEIPLALLAHGEAAPQAVLAARQGLPFLAALVLSSPHLRTQDAEAARWFARLGLGRMTPAGSKPWRRDGPDGVGLKLTHDPWRARVVKNWRIANPDLRRGDPNFGEIATAAGATQAVFAQPLTAVKAPVLILTGEAASPAADRLCKALSRCAAKSFPGGWPDLHLESDAVRRPWLAALAAALPRSDHAS